MTQKASIADGALGLIVIVIMIFMIVLVSGVVDNTINTQLNTTASLINTSSATGASQWNNSNELIAFSNLTSAYNSITDLILIFLIVPIFGVVILMLSRLGGWTKDRDSFTGGLENEARNIRSAIDYFDKKAQHKIEPKEEIKPKIYEELPKRLKSSQVSENYDLELYGEDE